MKQQHSSFFNNGSWLVILIVAAGIIGSGLTVWNYKAHVFSTRNAHAVSDQGIVEAFFPTRCVGKILPHQQAHVSFPKTVLFSSKAEVFSATTITQGEKKVLSVLLKTETPTISGMTCEVTIDATIPFQSKE